MNDITRATADDAGCWVEDWWGQYGTAHMISKANDWGYGCAGCDGKGCDAGELVALALRHLASMGSPGAGSLTGSEHEVLTDGADDVEAWLNEHVAPEGYSFGWHEGEFFLWPDAQWANDGWDDDEPALSLQFCHATQNLDITSWPSRELDTGEVRLWDETGTLIASVTLRPGTDGQWEVTGSDVTRWTDLEGYSTSWRYAMGRVTSRAGYQIPD